MYVCPKCGSDDVSLMLYVALDAPELWPWESAAEAMEGSVIRPWQCHYCESTSETYVHPLMSQEDWLYHNHSALD
jgi:hypothetical protein